MTVASVKKWVFENQPTVFNGLFVLYLLFFSEPFFRIGGLVLREEKEFPVFGIIILLIIALESIGLIEKFQSLRNEKASLKHRDDVLGVLVMIWMGHMLITVILGMLALQSFGIDLDEESMSVAMFLIPGLIIKELIMGGFAATIVDPPLKKKIPHARVVLANIYLFIFTCVSYTVIWESLLRAPSGSAGPGLFEFIVLVPLVLITFYIFYLPMHFGFLAEELLHAQNKSNRRWLVLSYLAAGIIGIWPMIVQNLS